MTNDEGLVTKSRGTDFLSLVIGSPIPAPTAFGFDAVSSRGGGLFSRFVIQQEQDHGLYASSVALCLQRPGAAH